MSDPPHRYRPVEGHYAALFRALINAAIEATPNWAEASADMPVYEASLQSIGPVVHAMTRVARANDEKGVAVRGWLIQLAEDPVSERRRTLARTVLRAIRESGAESDDPT